MEGEAASTSDERRNSQLVRSPSHPVPVHPRPTTPPVNQQVLPPDRDVRPRRPKDAKACVVIPAKPGSTLHRRKEPKGSIRERNAGLLFSEKLSDVVFVVGDERERIPAHSFLLASASQVFYAQFYGGFEKQSEICVSDIEPEPFRVMLRFVYTDEVELSAENVVGVLYAGKKYLLSGLREACVEFLDSRISAETVCLLLSQARLFDEPQLLSRCWEALDAEAEAALASPAFLDLDRDTFVQILSRDSLNASELAVFDAAVKWGGAEAEREGTESVRAALGSAFYRLRLPAMSARDFANGPARSGLLSFEEATQLFIRLAGDRFDTDPELPWDESAREGLPLHRCQRFLSSAYRSNQWRYRGRVDSIEFAVDRRVWVAGAGLYGTSQGAGKYGVKLELKLGPQLLATIATNVQCNGSSEAFPVVFERAVQVNPDQFYTISAVVEGGELSYFGQEGQTEVLVGGITFQFQSSSESTNGTGVQGGQLPEILFYGSP